MRITFSLICLIVPYFLFAGNCVLLPKGTSPKDDSFFTRYFITKSLDGKKTRSTYDNIVEKTKDYLFSNQSDNSKVEIYVELDKTKCTNPDFPLFVKIVNSSNLPIDRMRIEIGSFLEKKNGNSFFIESVELKLEDSKNEDFYIEKHSSHSLCVRAPHEDWQYKDDSSNPYGNPKKELIHNYNIDELKYYLLKVGCFVGFHEN